MKIVVLKGSPRPNGNSNALADEFIRGAKENGHKIFDFDCTHHKNLGQWYLGQRCNSWHKVHG